MASLFRALLSPQFTLPPQKSSQIAINSRVRASYLWGVMDDSDGKLCFMSHRYLSLSLPSWWTCGLFFFSLFHLQFFKFVSFTEIRTIFLSYITFNVHLSLCLSQNGHAFPVIRAFWSAVFRNRCIVICTLPLVIIAFLYFCSIAKNLRSVEQRKGNAS